VGRVADHGDPAGAPDSRHGLAVVREEAGVGVGDGRQDLGDRCGLVTGPPEAVTPLTTLTLAQCLVSGVLDTLPATASPAPADRS
jgi:hypothetical protein